MYATEFRCTEMADLLVRSNADVNVKGGVRINTTSFVDLFARRNADVNVKGGVRINTIYICNIYTIDY
jgi:hypothetical protein